MMGFYRIIICLSLIVTGISCSDEESVSQVVPETTGSFVDARHGYEYHWVRIGGLDWTTENSHYYTDDLTCYIYQPYNYGQSVDYTELYFEQYGYLYSLSGALAAVPEGWRLPTDEDWKKLEMALGLSSKETEALDWRGAFAGELMMQKNEGTMLNMQLGGYKIMRTTGGDEGSHLLGSSGFYWTSTRNESKDGEYYYFRKLFYNSPQVFRQSMEPDKNMLSVRFVRDAQ